MTDFSEIAKRYEKDSVVQKTASGQLFDLLKIQQTYDVLDIGCGAGNLTKQISEQTRGKIVGVDASEGMIREAIRNYGNLGIKFDVCSVEQMNYANCFDVIFCNSAFQWFKNPEAALNACYKALRPNGQIGIQAPAKKTYCPNYIQAIEKIKTDPYLKKQFSNFKAPWFFLESAKEYAKLFEKTGFEVLQACIDQVSSFHTPEEVFKIFDSGASAGYLNPAYYSCPISEDYKSAFKKVMLESFKEQANKEGRVNLVFFRIFLVAKKYSSNRHE